MYEENSFKRKKKIRIKIVFQPIFHGHFKINIALIGYTFLTLSGKHFMHIQDNIDILYFNTANLSLQRKA